MKHVRIISVTLLMLCIRMVYAQDVTPSMAQGQPSIAQSTQKQILEDGQENPSLVNKGLDWMGILAKAYNWSGFAGQNSTARAALTIPLAIALSNVDKETLIRKLEAMGLHPLIAASFGPQLAKPDLPGHQPYEKFISLAQYLIQLNQGTLLPMIPQYLFGKNVISPSSWTGTFINLLGPAASGTRWLSFDTAARFAAQAAAVAALTYAAGYTLEKIGRASGLLQAEPQLAGEAEPQLDPALLQYFQITLPLISNIQQVIVPNAPSPFNVMQKQILASYLKKCTDLLDALYNKNMPPTDAEKADFAMKYKKLLAIIDSFKIGIPSSTPVRTQPQPTIAIPAPKSSPAPSPTQSSTHTVIAAPSAIHRSSTPQRTKAWRAPQRSRSGMYRRSR